MTDMDTTTSFVAELKRWRTLRGLSQSKLAQAMQYDRSYISKIETGQEDPTADFAHRADVALQAGGALRQVYRQSQAIQQDDAPERTIPLGALDSGISKFYSDFVDIEADWDALFSASSTLDLAIMYGATWRNTHRKRLQALAERPDGRIRLVLPDPAPDSLVADLYARTLDISGEDFRRKVTDAISDFQTLGPRRHIEIYLTSSAFRHAVYLFARQGLLAFYALSSERISTPALLASDGELLSFMRVDFDRLLDHSNRIA